MSEKKTIKDQASYILELQRKVVALEAELRKKGANIKPTKYQQAEEIVARNKKRNKLPRWVQHLSD